MFLLKVNMFQWLYNIKHAFYLSLAIISNCNSHEISNTSLIEQILEVGPGSLGISIIAACFIGLVFTLQIVKEFLYLDAIKLIGAILSLAFVRELSPVLIAVIIIGRIGSSFTAEIATMQITEQIDALYLLKTDPLMYLVMPRVLACIFMMPLLNLFFFFTSLFSSVFTCYLFYSIHPWIFLKSAFCAVSFFDFLKSTLKTAIFAFVLSVISCAWGFRTTSSSKNVGKSITSSVVTNLLIIFILDFILSYLMFNPSASSIRSL